MRRQEQVDPLPWLRLFAWAGVRAISLGVVPGAEALELESAGRAGRSLLPPIAPTRLPPIEPLSKGYESPAATSVGASAYYPAHAAYPGYAPYPLYVPVRVAGARNSPPQIIYVNAPPGEPSAGFVPGNAMAESAVPLDFSFKPTMQTTPSFDPPKRVPGLDRLSVTAWAMMREQGGPDSLAGRGMLGGSEAGARLMWHATPNLAVTLRSSSPVNSQRGAEAALGIRYEPLRSLPVAVTLERRHAIKEYGRNAFAVFAEGGVYDRPMPWQSTLDGYFQAGVVDFNNPDWFVDGQIAVSRPVWGNVSAGLGAWGGAQSGLSRFDVGPRLSLRVRQRMRAHLDFGLNVAGNAEPGSGAVVTLAGDF